MNFPNITPIMVQAAARILAMRGTDMVLQWVEITADQSLDKNDEDTFATSEAQAEQKQDGFRALVHVVDHRLAGWQRFMEVQTGDLIIDYLKDLQLDGKQQPVILYNGVPYVQKTASKGLLEAWDVGGPNENPGVFRTLLLTPNA